MDGTLIIISAFVGAIAGGLAGLLTRRRGATMSGIAAAIAGVSAFAIVNLAYPPIERALVKASDDKAWKALEASMEQTGIDLKLLFEADPRIEEEFKREIVAILRQHGNNPEQVGRAAEKLGLDLYRKYIGPKAPYGSAEAVVEWGRAQLGLLETVAAISRENCGDVAIGRTAVLGILGKRVAPATNRAIAAAVAAYRTSNPANTPPTEKEMEGIWQNIFLGPGTPFTVADINAFTRIESIPRAQACELTIAFTKRILALPPADSVAALRTVLVEAAK